MFGKLANWKPMLRGTFVPVNIHNKAEASQWSTPLKCPWPPETESSRGHTEGQTLGWPPQGEPFSLESEGVPVHAWSEILPLAHSTAKGIAAQQQSLSSLAKVVLDNQITLDYLHAQHGGICTYAYYPHKVQTLDGKCLRVLTPTLPCYSMWPWWFPTSTPSLWHGTWQPEKVLPGTPRDKTTTHQKNWLFMSNAFEKRSWSKGKEWKRIKKTSFKM